MDFSLWGDTTNNWCRNESSILYYFSEILGEIGKENVLNFLLDVT